jgi:hypothetical protein
MSLSFLIDAAMLAFLAMTVFIAFRLNMNLKNFRDSRSEMEGLVNRLTANIERAEKAIAGLQVGARNSGSDLDKKTKEAKFLADELKFMTEAGNSLATRLEKLADRNKELVEKIEAGGGLGPTPSSQSAAFESTIVVKEQGWTANQSSPKQTDAEFGFAIQDREFDEDDLDDLDFELEEASGLQSQAEREFFHALQKRKTVGGRN